MVYIKISIIGQYMLISILIFVLKGNDLSKGYSLHTLSFPIYGQDKNAKQNQIIQELYFDFLLEHILQPLFNFFLPFGFT